VGTQVDHVAPESDQGRDDLVNPDVDRDRDVVAPRLEHQGGTSRLADAAWLPLGDEAELFELCGQGSDGAAVEPEPAGQRGAADRTVQVHAVSNALRLLRRSTSCPTPVLVGDVGGLPDRRVKA
jgi:hypothetical protein